MNSVTALLDWYKDSGLATMEITIPMVETTVLFIVLTICLLFRYSRAGLLVAYLFVYRWGWTFRDTLHPMDATMKTVFSTGYVVFGILVFTFAMVGMMHSARSGDSE